MLNQSDNWQASSPAKESVRERRRQRTSRRACRVADVRWRPELLDARIHELCVFDKYLFLIN